MASACTKPQKQEVIGLSSFINWKSSSIIKFIFTRFFHLIIDLPSIMGNKYYFISD